MTQRTHVNDDETRHQPDGAIAMLTDDHRQVRALFQQYADTADPYLQQIIAEHVFAPQVPSVNIHDAQEPQRYDRRRDSLLAGGTEEEIGH